LADYEELKPYVPPPWAWDFRGVDACQTCRHLRIKNDGCWEFERLCAVQDPLVEVKIARRDGGSCAGSKHQARDEGLAPQRLRTEPAPEVKKRRK
jgi:hypothetical protein